jgi:MinD superfamily P-loop ATPase
MLIKANKVKKLSSDIVKFFKRKPVNIPMVAVTGGKGGTGKTSVAINLATILSMKGDSVMLVDTDVDCPNDALLLGTELGNCEEIPFFKPLIDTEKCTKCGEGAKVCEEHALVYVKGRFPLFFEPLCSGCRACLLVCPSEAISKGCKILGNVCETSVNGIRLVTGELRPAESRTPLVVRATKEKAYNLAKQNSPNLIIVDTAPGVHNAVVRALQGADLALAVTEPTPLGAHDLQRILELTHELGIQTSVILNRADIPGGLRDIIYKLCTQHNVEAIFEIPLDNKLLESYVSGTPVVKKFPNASSSIALLKLANTLKEMIKNAENNI